MNILQMVEDYRFAAGQEKNPKLMALCVVEEYIEWYAENYGLRIGGGPVDPTAELKELADLVYVIFGLANAKGWDLNEAVKRVHENNLGRMYQEGDCSECDGLGYTRIGCVNGMSRECPACHGVTKVRWIERREDGKIMKNKDFPKVELGDLV